MRELRQYKLEKDRKDKDRSVGLGKEVVFLLGSPFSNGHFDKSHQVLHGCSGEDIVENSQLSSLGQYMTRWE